MCRAGPEPCCCPSATPVLILLLCLQLMAFVAEERKRYTVYPPPEQVFTWTQMCDIRDVSRAWVVWKAQKSVRGGARGRVGPDLGSCASWVFSYLMTCNTEIRIVVFWVMPC